MTQYNIFQAIVMSFYSRKLYRDVASNWGGKAFLYLFVLLALSWIPSTISMQYGLNIFYKKNADKIVVQMPVITIKDGKVTTPENRPYIISTPDTHENILVIDTSGHFTTLDQAKAQILITQTQVITQTRAHETRINELPATLNWVINPPVINGYLAHYLDFSWIFYFIAVLIFSFIGRIIQALIYSIIGKIFSWSCNAQLTYAQVMQITMVAITPVIVLMTIVDFSNLTVSHPVLISFLIAMAYLLYGVLANKNKG